MVIMSKSTIVYDEPYEIADKAQERSTMVGRVFSRIKRKSATRKDPYHVIPIPPRSVVRVGATDRSLGSLNRDKGRVFRIGYYGKMDGLDCIWLVNEDGEYEQTVDHKCLFRYFDIIVLSDETDLYGLQRIQLPPIRQAEKTREGKSGSRARKNRL